MRALVLAALLLAGLALSAGAAPGPNARDPLPTPAAVLSLSMSDQGLVLATTADPGSSVPAPGDPGPGVHTWHLWSAGGALLGSGSSDLSNCALRVQDLCRSDAVAGAIAADGSRFAVVANVAFSVTDQVLAHVLVGTPSGGITHHLNLAQPAVAIALDAQGTSLAVLERVPHLGAPDTAQVEWFEIAPSGFSPVMPPKTFNAPPTALALSADGLRLAVATDRLHVYARGAPNPAEQTAGPPRAVAIAGADLHGYLWGTAQGDLHYAIDGDPNVAYSGQMGAPVTALAQTRSGRAGAVGDAQGRIHLLAINATSPSPVQRLAVAQTGPDPVLQLAMAPDGRFTAVRTNRSVQLWQADGADWKRLWADERTAPAGVALGLDGDLVAAAVGRGVVLYDVRHAITAEAVSDTIAPGLSRTLRVDYRNDGNRDEEVAIEAWFPATWFVSVTPDNLTVPVDGNATTDVRIVLPSRAPPGTFAVLLNHTLASTGERGTTEVRVTVPARDLIIVDSVDAVSLGIRPGQTVQFTAYLENRGNRPGVGQARMTVMPDGWRATLDPFSVPLAPGARANLTVTLTAPDTAVDGDQGIVRLYTPDRADDPLSLVATVGARFDVNMLVPGQLTVTPGNATAVQVQVHNRGNVPDSVVMSVSGLPPDWQVHFPPGNQTLRDVGPDQIVVATILVTPPATVPEHFRAFARILATSQGDPTKAVERPVVLQVAGTGPPPPEPEGGVNWPVVGAVALAVLALAAFAGGYIFLRKTD